MSSEDHKILKLFQTEDNRRIEEEFTSMLTERNDLRLFFINEDEAYTDGKNIVVDPSMDKLYCDYKAIKNTEDFMGLPHSLSNDKFLALKMITRSQNIHESLHIIYTNFPPDLIRDKRGDSEFKKEILGSISNIIEDAFIESVGASEYDNMSLFLKFNRIARLYSNTPSQGTIQRQYENYIGKDNTEDEKQKEINGKLNLLMEYLNYFITMLLYPMVELEEPSEKLKDYIDKTKDLFMQASICGIADKRYEYVDSIFDEILDLLPDISNKEYKKYGQIKKLLLSIIGDEKTHSGNEMSINKYEHKGRNANITRRLFVDLNENKITDDLMEQYLYEISQFKNEKELSLVEQNRVAVIKEFNGLDLKASLLHKNIKVKVKYPVPDINMKKAYENIYNKYKININSYNSKFMQLLKGNVERNENGFTFGNGISSKNLGDIKRRFWYRKIEGVDVPDVAILFLIDGSGSMYGEKNKNAIISSVILHEVLRKQGIEHAIVEHRADYDEPLVMHNVLIDFNPKKNDKYNILRLDADGDNRDGLSLLWAEKFLKEKSQAENKVIISISDGVPAHGADGYEYYPPVSSKDTYNCVKKIEKDGISVIAVALENEKGDTTLYDNLKEIYDRIVDVDDMKHLTGQLLKLVSRLFM